jgi:hypothetical protein
LAAPIIGEISNFFINLFPVVVLLLFYLKLLK